MASLSCSADKCAHNMNGLCNAATVRVTGSGAETAESTGCDTFVQSRDTSAMSNFTNLNLAGELKQMFTNEKVTVSPDIVCEANKCMYNMENKCIANYVQVNGAAAQNSIETECETFKES